MAVRGQLADCLERLDGSASELELVGLCKRCLAFDPADRPRDAGEVARVVAEHLSAAEERAQRAELERVRAEAARLGVVQTPVLFGHVEGGLVLPSLRRGARYAAAFPESGGIKVGGAIDELAAFGIPVKSSHSSLEKCDLPVACQSVSVLSPVSRLMACT